MAERAIAVNASSLSKSICLPISESACWAPVSYTHLIQLCKNRRAVFMYTLRQLRQPRDGAVVRKGELAIVRFALYADIAVFCDDEPKKTALRFFSIIFAHFICCEAVVLI